MPYMPPAQQFSMHIHNFSSKCLPQMSLVPAAIANYLLGVVYYLTGASLNFFPALFAALVIALALQSLFAVSSCAGYCIYYYHYHT